MLPCMCACPGICPLRMVSYKPMDEISQTLIGDVVNGTDGLNRF